MKKAMIMVATALLAISAAAQDPDIMSTVVGKKLNFEAPLFGVTMKNVKPTWSLVAFGQVNLGYSYALHVPEHFYEKEYEAITGSGETILVQDRIPTGLHPGGVYGDISLLELRYRPKRDGNLFMLGLNLGYEGRFLPRHTMFDKNNEPVRTYYSIGSNDGAYSERVLSLEVGYVRESGDWSFGIQLLPGLGYSQYKNIYTCPSPIYTGQSNDTSPSLFSDNPILIHNGDYEIHMDSAIKNFGFRFGAKASVWYRKFGAFVSFRPNGWDEGPEYMIWSAGLSIRY